MNNGFKKFTAFLLVLCMFTGFNTIPVKADNEVSPQPQNILADSSNTSPIRQEFVSYDTPKHEVTWKVTVEPNTLSRNDKLRVAILLRYNSVKYGEWTIEDNNNSNLTDFKENIFAFESGDSHKYVENSFVAASGSSLKLTVHPVINKDKQVADLLIITKDDSTGIDVSKTEQAFTYKTCIVDPNIYMTNEYGKRFLNYASLFNGSNKISDGSAETEIFSYMLKTDAISIEDALKDLTNPKNINGTSSNMDGFNYENKTIVFRLHINASGIVDVIGGPTTDKNVQLGKPTITDTLPDGWDFVEVIKGKKFLIYEGSGIKDKVTAETLISDTKFVTPDFTKKGKASFTFDKLDKPYVVLVKARATDETLTKYYDKNKPAFLNNKVNIMDENKKYSAIASCPFKIKSQVLSLMIGKQFVEYATYQLWEFIYNPYILNYSNAKLEVVFPEGLDLLMDSKGNIKADGRFIGIYKNIIDKKGSTIKRVKVADIDKWTAYDPATRTLSFTIPDPNQGYSFDCSADTTTDAGSALMITYRLMEGQDIKYTLTSDYTIKKEDITETKKHSGYVEITKIDENGSALSDAEFTVFTEEDLPYRKGLTDQNGMRTLLALPEGNYILKETTAPSEYDLSKEEHKIRVIKDGDTFQTFIDGKSGSQANQTTLQNFRTGTKYGSIAIHNILDGNAAEKDKSFNFSIRIPGIQGDYACTKNTAGESGVITFIDGKAEFCLKGGEELEIRNLPADREYTVTESNYMQNGYTTVKSGDTGKITEKTQKAVFVNTKNSKNEGGDEGGNEGGGGGADNSSPATPSSVAVTLKAKLTLDKKAPAKSDYLFVLKNSNGDVMQTKSNVKGEILFDDLKFSSAGTYLYTVSEVPNGQSNMQYDPVIYTVEINVRNGNDFNYLAEVSYLKDGAAYKGNLLFENKSIIKISPKELLKIKKVNYLSWSLSDPMERMRMKQRRFLMTQHRVIKNKLIMYNK